MTRFGRNPGCASSQTGIPEVVLADALHPLPHARRHPCLPCPAERPQTAARHPLWTKFGRLCSQSGAEGRGSCHCGGSSSLHAGERVCVQHSVGTGTVHVNVSCRCLAWECSIVRSHPCAEEGSSICLCCLLQPALVVTPCRERATLHSPVPHAHHACTPCLFGRRHPARR